MTQMERKFSVKDVEMLLVSSTIVESAMANKAYLQSKRPTWADPFFDDLKVKIDDAIVNHLGIDGAKELRHATQALKSVQLPAISDLALAKVQIMEDFK